MVGGARLHRVLGADDRADPPSSVPLVPCPAAPAADRDVLHRRAFRPVADLPARRVAVDGGAARAERQQRPAAAGHPFAFPVDGVHQHLPRHHGRFRVLRAGRAAGRGRRRPAAVLCHLHRRRGADDLHVERHHHPHLHPARVLFHPACAPEPGAVPDGGVLRGQHVEHGPLRRQPHEHRDRGRVPPDVCAIHGVDAAPDAGGGIRECRGPRAAFPQGNRAAARASHRGASARRHHRSAGRGDGARAAGCVRGRDGDRAPPRHRDVVHRAGRGVGPACGAGRAPVLGAAARAGPGGARRNGRSPHAQPDALADGAVRAGAVCDRGDAALLRYHARARPRRSRVRLDVPRGVDVAFRDRVRAGGERAEQHPHDAGVRGDHPGVHRAVASCRGAGDDGRRESRGQPDAAGRAGGYHVAEHPAQQGRADSIP